MSKGLIILAISVLILLIWIKVARLHTVYAENRLDARTAFQTGREVGCKFKTFTENFRILSTEWSQESVSKKSNPNGVFKDALKVFNIPTRFEVSGNSCVDLEYRSKFFSNKPLLTNRSNGRGAVTVMFKVKW